MGRYPVSLEGINAFEDLKKKFTDISKDIDEKTDAVAKAVAANRDELGYLSEDVHDYLRMILKLEKEFLASVQRTNLQIDKQIFRIAAFLAGNDDSDNSSSGGSSPRMVKSEDTSPSVRHTRDNPKMAYRFTDMPQIGEKMSSLKSQGRSAEMMEYGYNVEKDLKISEDRDFLTALSEDIQYQRDLNAGESSEQFDFLKVYINQLQSDVPELGRLRNEHTDIENIAVMVMTASLDDDRREELEQFLPNSMDWFERSMSNRNEFGEEKGFTKRKVLDNGGQSS